MSDSFKFLENPNVVKKDVIPKEEEKEIKK